MRVLISSKLPPEVLQASQERFDVSIRDRKLPMDAAEARSALLDYDAIVPTLGDNFSQRVFDDLPHPRCKILANFGVGYNHINVDAAKLAGIVVTNTPGAVTDATADIALTLMLMTCRRAGEGERLLRANNWSGWHPTQLLGMHMTGKTLGIIGMGRIGQAIAKRCRSGFGMRVVFYNRSAKSLEGYEQFKTIKAVMEACDIVVIALPGGAETYHIINSEALSALRSHAILVNIARGDIIDEEALIKALSLGQIAGAGLDVYENEPEKNSIFSGLDNVVMTPHIGASTVEAQEKVAYQIAEQIVEFIKNNKIINQVNK